MCMNVLLHVWVCITCAVPAEARRSLEAGVPAAVSCRVGASKTTAWVNVLMETGI